jgi:hypothetical protein
MPIKKNLVPRQISIHAVMVKEITHSMIAIKATPFPALMRGVHELPPALNESVNSVR